MLYHYFYASRALSPFPGLVDFDILREAWAHNRDRGIGGYLLRTREAYFQWLEGPQAPLAELLERIARDPRHRDMTVLIEGPLAARNFSNWVMGYDELTEAEAARLDIRADQTGTAAVLDVLREKALLRIA